VGAISACSPTTPIVLAGGGNHQFIKHQQDVRLRAAAALDEEPDLITYSINGIAENRSEEVVDLYLTGYAKDDYSQDMKSIAIYQIGLIYMNRLNENRDDKKAQRYFQRHLIEFPYSILQDRVQKRLDIIEARKKETIKLTPAQILANADREALLAKSTQGFDEELTPMSTRAIQEGRLEDANGVYATVYENPGSSNGIKAKALYQMGLIYMSPHNKERSTKKATYFFRKIINEFSDTPQAKRAQQKISQLINDQ
jgi:TPR repeat protein